MKILRWLIIIVLTPVALLTVALTVVSVLGITVNLDTIRPMVEQTASMALDREIKIGGSVELLPTLTPSLEIHDVRINNPERWGNPDFVEVQLTRVQLSLLDLLKKEINIPEITAEGVRIHLESRKNDVNNWSFTPVNDKEKKESVEPEPSTKDQKDNALVFEAVDKLSLKDIEITYTDTVLKKNITFHLDELSGKAPAEEETILHVAGSLQGKQYAFDLQAGALNTFRPQEEAWPLEMSGTIAGTPFSAAGTLDNTNNKKRLNLDLSVGAVDIGGLFSWLQLAKDLHASTEKLELQLRLQGDNLNELLRQSAFTFKLDGGHLDLRNSGSESGILISKLSGDIGATPGAAVNFNLKGTIDTTPVTISIKGMPLLDYISDPGSLPVTIDFAGAGAELSFHGALNLPVESKTFSMAMTLKGQELNSLNEFLRIDLPPFGPYDLGAQFTATEKGYDLSNLAIKVGQSDISGSMSLNNTGEKPEIAIEFVSNILQLDDFALKGWSPEGKDTSTDKREQGEHVAKQAAEKKDTQIDAAAALLSPEALARFNATLSIEMTKVLSGTDLLGSGILKSSLQNGQFAISPLQLELADGSAEVNFSFYPTTEEAEIHLSTMIDNLDLGIIARRIKPEATMGGVLYLNIDLDSTAPKLNELMAYGQGHFDLGFVPVNFDAGLVDLWAVNLLSALASEVDEGPSSTINCLVASFSMEDGLMQERVIFMDTTHMSIDGEVNINFRTEQFKIKAAPKAKRPEYFSLATPVKVSGSFEDFKIKINKLLLTKSLASFITSPFHVPVKRLFVNERPEDGKEACLMAWKNRNIEKKSVRGVGD